MTEESERVVLDELIFIFRVPKSTPDPEAESARTVLASSWFLEAVIQAIAAILIQDSRLAGVSVEVSA